MLKSLEAWIGDNPNVIPESIIESLMSAASTSASEEANVATGETGGVSAESSLSHSGADSITGKHKSSTNTLAIIVMHERSGDTKIHLQ